MLSAVRLRCAGRRSQVRSLEMAAVTNVEHITVRSESALDNAELTTFPLRLQRRWIVDRKLE